MDLSQLDDEQKAVLKQFREATQDCKLPESDDTYLLRWLVARDFDLAKAEKMLRNSLDWRCKYKIDLLQVSRYQSSELLTNYLAFGHLGVDKIFHEPHHIQTRLGYGHSTDQVVRSQLPGITPLRIRHQRTKNLLLSLFHDTRNKKPLSISRGSKEQLEFQVKQAATVLKWDFHSEDSDIAFAVYRKQGNELIPIVPHDRVDCDVSPEEGEIDCYDTGIPAPPPADRLALSSYANGYGLGEIHNP
uniref:CRAL/TRIO N-terminal domain-containing protein n=1 Tax=Daphnia galeata TaxID=27404 RepID=A0A8J2S2U8_9CRUS|nr:unnamed protein product [Daphnia galeata]